jgi:hypothetical protein
MAGSQERSIYPIIFPSSRPISWHAEACDDNTSGLAHQQLEASLLEVMIAGEGFLQCAGPHCRE